MVVLNSKHDELKFTHFVHGNEGFLGTAREEGRIKLYFFKHERVFTKNGANDTWKELDGFNSERIRGIAFKAAKSGKCPEFKTNNLESIL